METKSGEPETDPLGCGSLYLVFDYVEHDLAGLIDIKYKFPAKAVKYIAKQLFEVLHFLHDRRIIHRVSFHCIYVMYIWRAGVEFEPKVVEEIEFVGEVNLSLSWSCRLEFLETF